MSVYEQVATDALDAISDGDLRLAVGELFAKAQSLVAKGSVNLVILAARRLSCLYQLLVSQGMPPIVGCPVVSDRFLEASSDWDWPQTRALVLDDSVVVGTTLARLHDDLVARLSNGGTARYLAVCLDSEQCAKYLLDGMEFELLRSRETKDVQRFSRQVVEALFRNQVPFFSDFPVSKPLLFTPESWARYLGSGNWHVADVTAPLLGDASTHAFAQIPTSATAERFLSRVVPQAAWLLDTFKIRSYVKHDFDGSVRVVFVPIAMLAPCGPDGLTAALNAIGATLGELGSDAQLHWADWAPEAKHRLVQLYLSTCALAEIWPDIASAAQKVSELTAEMLEDLPIDLYFGNSSAAAVTTFDALVTGYDKTPTGEYDQPPRLRLETPLPSPLLGHEDLQEVLWETRELLASIGLPEQPSAGELTKIGLVFAHAISGIFGFINRSYEEPQRQLIASLSSKEEYDDLFGDGDKRLLDQGLTMREIAASLTPDSIDDSPWTQALVSLGIDVGNDLGIVVPVTRYDPKRDVAYRCYRLGETAELADQPLTRAAWEGPISARAHGDAVTRGAPGGYPILPITLSIKDHESADFQTAVSLESLWRIVIQAVPGRVESCYEGTVIDVGEDYFEANLVSPLGDDERVARIGVGQIRDEDRDRLERGARVTWSIFANEVSGAKKRTSSVRLPQRPALKYKELYRGVEILGQFVRDID